MKLEEETSLRLVERLLETVRFLWDLRDSEMQRTNLRAKNLINKRFLPRSRARYLLTTQQNGRS